MRAERLNDTTSSASSNDLPRRLRSTVIALLILSSIAFLNSSTAEGSSGMPAPPSSIQVKTVVTRTLKFKHPTVQRLDGFDHVIMGGCGFTSEAGSPMLPVKGFVVELPSLNIVEVEFTASMPRALPGKFKIYPAQPPRRMGSKGGQGFVEPDPRVYSSTSPYPGKIGGLVYVSGYQGRPMAYVRVFPVHYLPASGELLYHEEVEVSITTTASSSQPLAPPQEATLDYLIITRPRFLEGLQPLIDWRRSRGMRVAVETVDDIVVARSGRDVPEKVRSCIRQYYVDNGIKWVLLVGDADPADGPPKGGSPNYVLDKDWEVPTRYAWNPDEAGDNLYTNMDESFTPTDFYYAGLDGTWDADNDNRFGESSAYSAADEADWFAEVYVGRLPVRENSELQVIISKTINLENDASPSLNFLLLGGKLDADPLWKNYCKKVKETIRERYAHPSLSIRTYYEPDGNLSFNIVNDAINTYDPLFINAASHGYPSGLALSSGGDYMNKSTEGYLANSGFLQYAVACLTCAFDISYDTLGENLLKAPARGAAAYIGGARVLWVAQSGGTPLGAAAYQDYRFWDEFFTGENYPRRPGSALYESKVRYIQEHAPDLADEAERKDLFATLLLGDPALFMGADLPSVARPSPTDDAFVAEGLPNLNFGSENLYVQSSTSPPYKNERTFLKFDLFMIPSDAIIAQAKLRLHCWKGREASMDAQVRGVESDSWSEGTIMWGNQPVHGGVLDNIPLENLAAENKWHSWDVTPFVENQLRGDKVASFCIKAAVESASGQYAFYSKEWGFIAFHPYLEIVYVPPRYEVSVSVSPSENHGVPGATLSYSVIVLNLGNVQDNYRLTAIDNLGWGPTLSDNYLAIPAGENRATTLTVVVPENALPGSEDNIAITATSQADNTVSASASCIARAEKAMLSVSPGLRNGSPGDNLLYAVVIANLRSAEDIYALSATDNKGWEMTFYENSLRVRAGENGSTILRVAIPPSEALGAVDNITITATSLTDPQVSASISCAARVGRVALLPAEDAQVVEGYPDTNYGGKTYIYVGNDLGSAYKNERGFFKFDLSTVPENMAVASVRFHNYCWRILGAAGENVQARAVDNDGWGELTITWNNQPAHGAVLDTKDVPSTNSWYHWDVTPFVENELAGDRIASLCLRAEVEGQVSPNAFAYAFESKEWGEIDKRPYLEILDAAPIPLTVSIAARYQRGIPGVRLDYAVVVMNDGGVPENYCLSASDNAGWASSISPASLTIAPRQSGSAKLSIFVPESARGGDSTRVIVVATSSSGASDFSSSTATAWLGTRTGRIAISNPYKNYPYWYRGNLHSHTENSDGENTASEMMGEYRSRGYHFNAISDHNHITDSEAFTDLPYFLGINAEEDTPPNLHIVAIDIATPIDQNQSVSKRVIDILAQGGVAIVAHPGLTWPLENVRQAVGAGARLMEIHGDPPVGLKSRQYWDIILSENKLVHGVMSDDAHSTSHVGRWGWNMVNAKSLSKADILQALREGNFYCVESPPGSPGVGPAIYSITVENENVIVVNAAGDYSLFIGDNGALLDNRQLVEGVASYSPPAWVNYVRMEVHGGGGTSYTQPLMISVAKFKLATLFKLGVDLDVYVEENSKLILKFYTYSDAYQGENVIWGGETPIRLALMENVPHPENKAVERAVLVVVKDNSLQTIASFTVAKGDLVGRISEIKSRWPYAPPEERSALLSEISGIKSRWPYAPT